MTRGEKSNLRAPCAALAERCKALEELFYFNWRVHLFDRAVIDIAEHKFSGPWPERLLEQGDFREAFFTAFLFLRNRDAEGFKKHIANLSEELRKEVLNYYLFDLWGGNMAFAVTMARMPELMVFCLEQGANPRAVDGYDETAGQFQMEYIFHMWELHGGMQKKVILAPHYDNWNARIY